jgi:signal transduction histidine kinase/ligand-binding sensor domain-containing protein
VAPVCLRLAAVAAGAVVAAPGHASERLTRVLTHEHGLDTASVNALAQDELGYLWIGSEAGLIRYDGHVFERWAPDVLGELVHDIATGPGPRIVVSVRGKGLWEVRDGGAVEVFGPDGAQLTDVHQAAFAPDGALWIVKDGALRRAAPGGEWADPVALPDDDAYGLAIDSDGVAWVGGGRALWRVTAGGRAEHLAELPQPGSSVTALREGGCAVAASFSGQAFVYRDGRLAQIASLENRVVSVVERGDRLWVAWDKHLGFVAPGQPAHVFHVRDGGRLLVDREGSLWMATFRGLVQYPEPDTVLWGAPADGLESAHTRAVTRGPEGVWFTAWAAPPYLLDETTDQVRTADESTDTLASPALCTDGDGVVWGGGLHGLTARRAGTWHHYPLAGTRYAERCATAPDGRVWFATDGGLFLVGGQADPHAVTPLPGSGVQVVYEDTQGVLWIGFDETVCHGSAAAARAGGDLVWTCDRVVGSVHPTAILETERGTLWLATRQAGLLYRDRDGGRWAPVPSANALPGRYVSWLASSPRGGAWVATAGALVRVREGETPTAPWTELERLGTWNGLPRPAASAVLEEPDGTVWLATSAGLARVPPAARDPARPPPSVSLVRVRADGRELAAVAAPELAYDDHHVELAFSAPTFRDPALLRYRLRLGSERAWLPPTREPVFNFLNLPPGKYHIEVEASLDGSAWSRAAAGYAFSVARPWWLQPWLWVAAALTVAAVAYAAYRVRLALALRLERQRTRIAADLHDEMGSGLGSIGLLAGVASATGGTDGVADKIADTAAELGDALTDIVWSLRAGSGSPQQLAAYLTRKGESLFPGGGAAFATALPEAWPRTELSLPVRRNLQLIASEALHNVARHARAAHVRLGFEAGGKRWTLWVEDDGVGIDSAAKRRAGGGLGLDNMRRRAAQIDAELAIEPATGGGTRVTVRFDPRARDRSLP